MIQAFDEIATNNNKIWCDKNQFNASSANIIEKV